MASEIKPIAGLNRIKLSDAVPLDTPFSIFLFPTTFCNFKCAYCAHSLGHEGMKEQYGFTPETMSMETFELAVEQLCAFPKKIKQISLTGQGEPLLNPHIADMVKRIKTADITNRLEIISNASLLTKELADQLAESGLDCLRVSIQGVKTEKYTEICKSPVSFEQIVENLSYFSRIKGDCQLYVKVMDVALDGREEEELFYRTFQDISDRMYIESCRPVYDGVEFTKALDITKDRYGREHEHREVCPLPFFMLSVFPNGDVEPCDTIYKPVVLGNIHETTLLEMWDGPILKEFRIMQLNKERNGHKGCSVCCAPDDVSHPEDVLDADAEQIKTRL